MHRTGPEGTRHVVERGSSRTSGGAVARSRCVVAGALIAGGMLLAAGGLAPFARAQDSPAPAQCTTTHWVAGWTADPSGVLGPGFADQTLRVILTPHIASDRLRVHLSNRFGSGPVTFTGASVALRASGASVVAGSRRRLRFAGRPAVTVPAGGEAVSDPTVLGFSAFQDLAVSLYVRGASGPVTGHLIGRERSYATMGGSGDHTMEDAAGAFAAQTTMVDYVSAVDALAPTSVGAAVVFGDSIIDGYENVGLSGGEQQGGIDLNHRFPDYLARRLLAQPGGPRLSVLNAGVSGNRLLGDAQAGMAGASGLSRLDSDVLGVAGVSDAIVLEGTNDIFYLASADQITAALEQIVARLHARGVRVLLGTLIPAGTGLLGLGNILPGVYVDSPQNVVRVAVNAWIRSGRSGADGIVDFDSALRGSAQPNVLDPGVDSGDHVHPNSAGYSRMADTVNLDALHSGQCVPRAATTLRVRARPTAGGWLRVSGSLLTADPADCTGARVLVRTLLAGHTIFKRRLRVTGACDFAKRALVTARGRIEVRVSFPGSPALEPTHARSLFVRAH